MFSYSILIRFVAVFSLIAALLFVIFQSGQDENIPEEEGVDTQLSDSSDGKQQAITPPKIRTEKKSVQEPIQKIDRTSPDAALNCILQSLVASNFKQFIDSFSQAGKQELFGTGEISENKMTSMSKQLAEAGFHKITVVSKDIEENGDVAKASVIVVSNRNGRDIKEVVEIRFTSDSGVWLADSFEVNPMPADL